MGGSISSSTTCGAATRTPNAGLALVPFWEQPLHQWDGMFTAGVRAHLTAEPARRAADAAPRHGLIVSTTANLGALGTRNVFYDLAKNAIARLTWAMAQELREHGIATLAVAPGFMRTERVVEAFRRAGALDALDGPGGPKETTSPSWPCDRCAGVGRTRRREVGPARGRRHACARVRLYGRRRNSAASVPHSRVW